MSCGCTRGDITQSRAPQRPASQPGALAFRATYAATEMAAARLLDTAESAVAGQARRRVARRTAEFLPIFARINNHVVRRVDRRDDHAVGGSAAAATALVAGRAQVFRASKRTDVGRAELRGRLSLRCRRVLRPSLVPEADHPDGRPWSAARVLFRDLSAGRRSRVQARERASRAHRAGPPELPPRGGGIRTEGRSRGWIPDARRRRTNPEGRSGSCRQGPGGR